MIRSIKALLVLAVVVLGSTLLHASPLAVYSQSAEQTISSVAWSPDGARIAAGYSQGEVRVWDAATGSVQASFQTGEEEWAGEVSAFLVSTLSWSPDGRLLAAGLGTIPPGGFIQVIDAGTGQILESLYVGYDLKSIAWSPDGSMLAAGLTVSSLGAYEGWIRVWDSTDFQLVAEFRHGYASDVAEIAWSPDGSKLASGGYNEAGWDNSVRTWDTTQWTLLQTFEHPDFALSVAWSPDGTKLASAGGGVPGRIWDATTGQQLIDLQTDDLQETIDGAYNIVWRPNSSQVVSQTTGKILVWDSNTGQVIEERTLWPYSLNLAWNPDGTKLAYGSDTEIQLIDDIGIQ